MAGISTTQFNIAASTVTETVKNKNLQALLNLGGAEGVASAVGTNPSEGISGSIDDIRRRSQHFGTNTFRKPPKGFLYFLMDAFKGTAIIILFVWAALALGFGIYVDGVEEGWHDGGSLFVAVLCLAVLSAFSNFSQKTHFEKLSDGSVNFKVGVVRNGQRREVSRFDLVVGDVVFLSIGDQIPADGLFLDGDYLLVDESSITGQSNFVHIDSKNNPFVFSGTKVAAGACQMLVVSVGMNTEWGQMMSSISRQPNETRTPLEAWIHKLISSIGRFVLVVALLVLIYLLFHYFTGKTKDQNGKKEYNGSKTDLNDVFKTVALFVAAVTAVVVPGIPGSLSLCVFLALADSVKRMKGDQAMVRKPSACETMGSATVICTDKTGTLTLNQMKVIRFWLGQESIEEESYKEVATDVLELIHQAVSLNTSGRLGKPVSGSVPEISGSPTEKAIILWGVEELGMNMEEMKQRYTIVRQEAFTSEKKRSGVSIRKKADNTVHVHWKGATEIILAMCSYYCEKSGNIKTMDEDERRRMENIINGMAASCLRCIAFAHKQIQDGTTHMKEDGLTLLGIVALKNPCQPDIRECVEICKSAGVDIKMITGDNVFTAKAIATECGILQYDEQATNDQQVVEGIKFRDYTQAQRMEGVDKIRVMARSSPSDKLLLVQSLKEKGHVVAVIGDDINDVSALREADIRLSMGIQDPWITKENPDIIILDNKFTTVAAVLRWGRCVYNIQKFIQFQLTINVAALVINCVEVFTLGESPLTTVQLLWVNLIMGTLGAFALATERPADELIKRPPKGRSDPLLTNIIWRNLLSQALYQIAISLILQFKGKSILKLSRQVIKTMIFNTFVLCQVFNLINARKLETKNIFKGIHRNRLLLVIVGTTLGVQFLMVELSNKFASTERLNLRQWQICVGLAAITWPIGLIVKFISVPEKPVLFMNSQGELEFGFIKCLKFLLCVLKLYLLGDCDH